MKTAVENARGQRENTCTRSTKYTGQTTGAIIWPHYIVLSCEDNKASDCVKKSTTKN